MYQTIGSLITVLSACPPAARVYIDNRPPVALSSYRGYYDQLAIEREGTGYAQTALGVPGNPFDINMAGIGRYTPGSHQVSIREDATVAELLLALRLADGATFEGYKGGQYLMDQETNLWVSEYGCVESLRISSLEDLGDRVDLWTTPVEW